MGVFTVYEYFYCNTERMCGFLLYIGYLLEYVLGVDLSSLPIILKIME